jgi:hypothetical protein
MLAYYDEGPLLIIESIVPFSPTNHGEIKETNSKKGNAYSTMHKVVEGIPRTYRWWGWGPINHVDRYETNAKEKNVKAPIEELWSA